MREVGYLSNILRFVNAVDWVVKFTFKADELWFEVEALILFKKKLLPSPCDD